MGLGTFPASGVGLSVRLPLKQRPIGPTPRIAQHSSAARQEESYFSTEKTTTQVGPPPERVATPRAAVPRSSSAHACVERAVWAQGATQLRASPVMATLCVFSSHLGTAP